jgi:hypothetical protein
MGNGPVRRSLGNSERRLAGVVWGYSCRVRQILPPPHVAPPAPTTDCSSHLPPRDSTLISVFVLEMRFYPLVCKVRLGFLEVSLLWKASDGRCTATSVWQSVLSVFMTAPRGPSASWHKSRPMRLNYDTLKSGPFLVWMQQHPCSHLFYFSSRPMFLLHSSFCRPGRVSRAVLSCFYFTCLSIIVPVSLLLHS